MLEPILDLVPNIGRFRRYTPSFGNNIADIFRKRQGAAFLQPSHQSEREIARQRERERERERERAGERERERERERASEWEGEGGRETRERARECVCVCVHVCVRGETVHAILVL